MNARAAALLLGFGVWTSCGRSPGPTEREANTVAQAVLRLPLETAIATLDPAEAQDSVSRRIVGGLFDTLIDWDPVAAPARLQAELAELPSVTDDGLSLHFRLRAGARFHDDPCFPGGRGRAVRASDVAASLLRHGEPGLARPRARHLLAGRIVGLDAHWRDPGATLPVGLEIDDDRGELVVRLTRPQPELPAILANVQLAVVPPECVAHWNGLDRAHFRDHPVGSGPFSLDHARSVPGRAAVLLAHREGLARVAPPEVAGAGEPLPLSDTIVLERIAAERTALRLFQAGELALFAPGPGQWSDLFALDGSLRREQVPAGSRVHESDVLSATWLLFAVDDPITADVDLRRAIAAAFDVERYVAVLRSGVWSRPLAQAVPAGIAGHEPAADHPHGGPRPDLAGARAALARRAEPVPPLHYVTDDGPDARNEAALLAEALRPLGLELHVTHDPHYLARFVLDPAGRNARRPQLFAIRFDADWPAAENFLEAFACGSGLTGWCDPEYDRLLAELARSGDPAVRHRRILELERRLGNAVPMRPIDQPRLHQVAQPWLDPPIRHPLAGLRLELLRVRGAATPR